MRMCAEIAAATAAPPATARLPPSQKSFCTSTTISARVMALLLAVHGLQYRLAPRQRPRLGRQRRPYLLVVRPCLRKRLGGAQVTGDGSAPDQGDDEVAVAV